MAKYSEKKQHQWYCPIDSGKMQYLAKLMLINFKDFVYTHPVFAAIAAFLIIITWKNKISNNKYAIMLHMQYIFNPFSLECIFSVVQIELQLTCTFH